MFYIGGSGELASINLDTGAGTLYTGAAKTAYTNSNAFNAVQIGDNLYFYSRTTRNIRNISDVDNWTIGSTTINLPSQARMVLNTLCSDGTDLYYIANENHNNSTTSFHIYKYSFSTNSTTIVRTLFSNVSFRTRIPAMFYYDGALYSFDNDDTKNIVQLGTLSNGVLTNTNTPYGTFSNRSDRVGFRIQGSLTVHEGKLLGYSTEGRVAVEITLAANTNPRHRTIARLFNIPNFQFLFSTAPELIVKLDHSFAGGLQGNLALSTIEIGGRPPEEIVHTFRGDLIGKFEDIPRKIEISRMIDGRLQGNLSRSSFSIGDIARHFTPNRISDNKDITDFSPIHNAEFLASPQTIWKKSLAKLEAYDRLNKRKDPSQDISVPNIDTNSLIDDRTAVFFNGITFWVIFPNPERGSENITKAFAYDRTTKQRDSSKDISFQRPHTSTYISGIRNLVITNSPSAITTDGTLVWMLDVDLTHRPELIPPELFKNRSIRAYRLSDGQAVTSKDINLENYDSEPDFDHSEVVSFVIDNDSASDTAWFILNRQTTVNNVGLHDAVGKAIRISDFSRNPTKDMELLADSYGDMTEVKPVISGSDFLFSAYNKNGPSINHESIFALSLLAPPPAHEISLIGGLEGGVLSRLINSRIFSHTFVEDLDGSLGFEFDIGFPAPLNFFYNFAGRLNGRFSVDLELGLAPDLDVSTPIQGSLLGEFDVRVPFVPPLEIPDIPNIDFTIPEPEDGDGGLTARRFLSVNLPTPTVFSFNLLRSELSNDKGITSDIPFDTKVDLGFSRITLEADTSISVQNNGPVSWSGGADSWSPDGDQIIRAEWRKEGETVAWAEQTFTLPNDDGKIKLETDGLEVSSSDVKTLIISPFNTPYERSVTLSYQGVETTLKALAVEAVSIAVSSNSPVDWAREAGGRWDPVTPQTVRAEWSRGREVIAWIEHDFSVPDDQGRIAIPDDGIRRGGEFVSLSNLSSFNQLFSRSVTAEYQGIFTELRAVAIEKSISSRDDRYIFRSPRPWVKDFDYIKDTVVWTGAVVGGTLVITNWIARRDHRSTDANRPGTTGGNTEWREATATDLNKEIVDPRGSIEIDAPEYIHEDDDILAKVIIKTGSIFDRYEIEWTAASPDGRIYGPSSVLDKKIATGVTNGKYVDISAKMIFIGEGDCATDGVRVEATDTARVYISNADTQAHATVVIRPNLNLLSSSETQDFTLEIIDGLYKTKSHEWSVDKGNITTAVTGEAITYDPSGLERGDEVRLICDSTFVGDGVIARTGESVIRSIETFTIAASFAAAISSLPSRFSVNSADVGGSLHTLILTANDGPEVGGDGRTLRTDEYTTQWIVDSVSPAGWTGRFLGTSVSNAGRLLLTRPAPPASDFGDMGSISFRAIVTRISNGDMIVLEHTVPLRG